MSSLALGTWNVRTLLDRDIANRPERKTVLVAAELKCYNINIRALNETRLAEEGQLPEVGAAYTFFWIGKRTDERREAGVGFAIKMKLVKQLAGPPKGINDRLMSVRLPLQQKRFATIISVYAPTMANSENVIEKFYEDLKSAIGATPKADKLIILGDFNARVGEDWRTWEGVLGRHGIGKCNSNGLLLLQTCALFNLLITNTSSSYHTITGHNGCTLVPNIGIYLTTSLCVNKMDRMLGLQRPCVGQSAGQTIE